MGYGAEPMIYCVKWPDFRFDAVRRDADDRVVLCVNNALLTLLILAVTVATIPLMLSALRHYSITYPYKN